MAVVTFALACVCTHALASEGGDGLVSLSAKLVLLQILNFALFVLVLRFAIRRWLLPRMRARTEAIRRAIEDAERGRAEVERLRLEHEKATAEVRARAKEILDAAAAQAAREKDDLLRRARTEANAAVDRARVEIERERLRAVAEIRREVADLTVRATRRLIGREMDEPTNKQLVEEFLSSLDEKAVGR